MLNMLFLTGGGFDVTTALEGAVKTGQKWGGIIIVLIGVLLIIGAAVKIFKFFTSQGGQRESILMILAMVVVGGAFAYGGWKLAFGLAKGGKKTLNDLPNATDKSNLSDGIQNTILMDFNMLTQ